MNDKMKAWILEQPAYCYGAVVLAKSKKEAIKKLIKNHVVSTKGAEDINKRQKGITLKSVELNDDFFFSAGGNG